MAMGLEQPGPVVRARARLHADQAGRQRSNHLQQLAARHARAHQHGAARGVRAKAKTFLARSIPRVTIAMVFPFLNELMRHSHFPSWHFVATRRNTRPVRDGKVRFIR